MKLMLPLTVTALLIAGPALAADCAIPKPSVEKIPNGSQATKEQLLEASKAVKEYNAAVNSYQECLKTQQDSEIDALGDKATDEQRNKIVAKYVQMGNTQVDKVQKLADQLNAEIRAFKAKNPS